MQSKKPTVSEEDKALFRSYIGKVERLSSTEPVIILKNSKSRNSNRGKQKPLIERFEELNDSKLERPFYDHQSSVTSEECLYFNRGGLQEKAQRKLKRGRFLSQAELDLHGFTVAQAYLALMNFLEDCAHENIRHVRIIHGKGYRAQSDYPILKNKVNNWLRDHPQVLAFSSANKNDGGAGALYVWLRQID